MSIQETTTAVELAPTVESAVPETAAQRLSESLERAGEWLNPLLVKECRQALKSKWFAIVFTLVIVACWGWSIIGVAQLGPDAAYQSYGPDMFFGYYIILAVPLMMVPFAAFRSLISEREDNTYELVAITTLRPRQIIGGKLGSAVLQMLIYFSAVAPCLAFTYMLRGVDVVTICFILYYTFMASAFFSLLALFIATLAKEKHWQVVLSVILVIGLFYAFIGAIVLCGNILRSSGVPVQYAEFWEGNFVLLTAVCAVSALLYLAAAAQLTFPSENRSTPLRITMLVHQGIFIAILSYFAVRYGVQQGNRDTIARCSFLLAAGAAFYWFFMGSLMTGEAAVLSERVKRHLPRSDLARLLLTWFNPGPGTGYLFAMSNLLAAGALSAVGAFWWQFQGRTGSSLSLEVLLCFIAIMVSYVAIYLGVTNLLLGLIRRVAEVTVALSFLINLLLLMCGFGLPWLLREITNFRGSGYTLLHITDPLFTCEAVLEPQFASGVAPELLLILIVPPAIVVFLLNLVYIAPVVNQVRIARPLRVEEDEQELHALPLPPPTNPWD